MRIGIIGAGNIGGTLGKGWMKKGHSVKFGLRDASASKLDELRKEVGAEAEAASVREAASFGDVVVLATPWGTTEMAIRSAGNLSGKTLLDYTNPIAPDLSRLELGLTTSGGEQVAQWATGAHVVKIFHTTGYDNMASPVYPEGRAVMFYCGDNGAAKKTAHQLAADLGFDPADAGLLTAARLLEPYAMLWIQLAIRQGFGLNFAFRLMRR